MVLRPYRGELTMLDRADNSGSAAFAANDGGALDDGGARAASQGRGAADLNDDIPF